MSLQSKRSTFNAIVAISIFLIMAEYMRILNEILPSDSNYKEILQTRLLPDNKLFKDNAPSEKDQVESTAEGVAQLSYTTGIDRTENPSIEQKSYR